MPSQSSLLCREISDLFYLASVGARIYISATLWFWLKPKQVPITAAAATAAAAAAAVATYGSAVKKQSQQQKQRSFLP